MLNKYNSKNWFSAIGLLFIIVALIAIVRQLLIWGPEFVLDFFFNSEITNEKVSAGMIIFGFVMILIGIKKDVKDIRI